jgi:hypothetical protein
MTRLSNRYLLDITIASWLFLFSIGLFIIYYAIYSDYECVNNADFLCGSDYINLASNIGFLIGSLWFVHLTYPEQMEAEMISIFKYIEVEDFNNVDFGNRYIYGSNFSILGWVFVLAALPLIIIPIWAFAIGAYTVDEFLLYFFLYLGFILISFYFAMTTIPESMIANNGRGSSYLYNTIFACCLGPLYNDEKTDFKYPDTTLIGLFQKHLGSDFLFSVWFLLVLSIVQLVYTIYQIFVGDDKYIWISFMASLFLAIGSGLFVYTSYPNSFFSRYWWCLVTFQEDEKLEFSPELNSIMNEMAGISPGEYKPLI